MFSPQNTAPHGSALQQSSTTCITTPHSLQERVAFLLVFCFFFGFLTIDFTPSLTDNDTNFMPIKPCSWAHSDLTMWHSFGRYFESGFRPTGFFNDDFKNPNLIFDSLHGAKIHSTAPCTCFFCGMRIAYCFIVSCSVLQERMIPIRVALSWIAHSRPL